MPAPSSRRLRFLPLLIVPLFAACATAPKPLQGTFTVIEPRDVTSQARVGEPVRWGGSIIAVEPEAQRTCLQILSRELAATARPRDRDISQGRFVACREGFYDPEVFEEGRDVTVVGRIAALTERRVGEYPYAMPEVAADTIYLWPERREYPAHYPYPYPFYDPFWSVGPYGRWWWGASYGPVRVIHHPRPRPVRPGPRGRG